MAMSFIELAHRYEAQNVLCTNARVLIKVLPYKSFSLSHGVMRCQKFHDSDGTEVLEVI
jgi:hypothetical protein